MICYYGHSVQTVLMFIQCELVGQDNCHSCIIATPVSCTYHHRSTLSVHVQQLTATKLPATVYGILDATLTGLATVAMSGI